MSEACRYCGGQGQVWSTPENFRPSEIVQCNRCAGSGRTKKHNIKRPVTETERRISKKSISKLKGI